jgi:hypothetical protein
LAAGAVVFILGIGFAVQNWFFINRAEATTGAITEVLLIHGDQDQSDTYRPVFTFKTADGFAHQVQSDVDSSPSNFQIGQRVNVVYSPKAPDDAKIDSIGQLWFFPLLFVGIGSAAVCCGLIGRRLFARRTRQSMLGGLKSELSTIRGAIRSWGFS